MALLYCIDSGLVVYADGITQVMEYGHDRAWEVYQTYSTYESGPRLLRSSVYQALRSAHPKLWNSTGPHLHFETRNLGISKSLEPDSE